MCIRDRYKEVAPEEGDIAVKVTLKGLRGGHSGLEINEGRANACLLYTSKHVGGNFVIEQAIDELSLFRIQVIAQFADKVKGLLIDLHPADIAELCNDLNAEEAKFCLLYTSGSYFLIFQGSSYIHTSSTTNIQLAFIF